MRQPRPQEPRAAAAGRVSAGRGLLRSREPRRRRTPISPRARRSDAAGTMGCCTGRCSLICLCALQLVSAPRAPVPGPEPALGPASPAPLSGPSDPHLLAPGGRVSSELPATPASPPPRLALPSRPRRSAGHPGLAGGRGLSLLAPRSGGHRAPCGRRLGGPGAAAAARESERFPRTAPPHPAPGWTTGFSTLRFPAEVSPGLAGSFFSG